MKLGTAGVCLLLVCLGAACSREERANRETTTQVTLGALDKMPTAVATSAEPARSAAWVKLKPGKDSVGALVKSEVAKAPAATKPVVYLGASWCPPCNAIKRYGNDPLMVGAFKGAFVIELDVDDWTADDLKALGYSMSKIPVFISVGADGKSNGSSVDGSAWGDDVPANMAPPIRQFVASLK